jgi:hypothetical protein
VSANAKTIVSLASERLRRAGLGHGSASFIGDGDPRWDCHSIVEMVTESFDPDLLGVGSSPWQGDASSIGIRVPTGPTRFQTERYWFRLLQVQIDKRRAIIIRGIWQYATIRASAQSSTPPCHGVPVELEVTSPGWHFQDANISWHLRLENHKFTPESIYDANQPNGASPSVSGQDAALLYVPPFLPYRPPGAGLPPGAAVDFLGTWRDLRYQDPSSNELAIAVLGPGRLTFYASVHQTNPIERCPIIVPPGVGRPEDQFVAAYEALGVPVTYGRVAGGLAVELFPCCEDLPKGTR